MKRDLESGRTASLTTATDPRTAGAASGERTAGEATPPPLTPQPPSGQTAPLSSPSTATPRYSTRVIAAALVIGLVAAAAFGYFRGSASNPPAATTGDTSASAFVQSRFELAERSLQAGQFRDAQRHAEDVLGTEPTHAKARAIRDQAAASLRQAETAIDRARQLIQAGDVRGAVRALDDARTIDPVAPGLSEVSRLMAERFKTQAEAAELELQRSRASQSAQRAAAPPGKAAPTPTVPTPTPSAPASQPLPAPAPPPPPSPSPIPAAEPPPAKPAPPETAAIKPAPSPVNPPADRKPPAETPREPDDDAAIRAVVAAYVRAIESKDLALFRSIKPNLGAAEERRIEQGFRAVTSQKVNITIASIDRRGDRATLQLRRQDIIEAAGRRQSPESQQTMTMTKSNGTWVIVEIGR